MHNILDKMIFIMGTMITISVTASLFGLFSGSSKYYTLFVMLIMVSITLITLKDHILPMWIRGIRQKFLASSIFGGCLLAMISSAWIWHNANRLDLMAPFFSDNDVIMGLLLAVGLVIIGWVHWGAVISITLILSIAYFWFGNFIPISWLKHPGYDPGFIMNYISLNSTLGFYWFAQTTVDDLFYLVIYASVLLGTGTVKVMQEIGSLLGRRLSGGAASTAVVGSGMTSMVMGVAVSNVQLTGRFTIPLMKRWGYSNHMASAIEAAASTSGQIMPPVLGLVAFVVATFLGIKYLDIVYASVYPAILYMTGVSASIWIFARANSLPCMERNVNWKILTCTLPTFVISFSVVCYLLVNLYSASLAGIAGSIVALIMSQFQGPHRPSWAELRDSIHSGFIMIAVLAVLMIAIGPIGQVFVSTNLSARTTATLMAWLPDIPLLLLAITAALTLILGAPLPTPVAYLMVALTMVPLLQDLGLAGLTAHFFVFYFAALSALSPPVAVASLAAAKIGQADLWRTSIEAMKIAATVLPIPFIFVYHPGLLSFPTVSLPIMLVIFTTIISQITLALSVYGFEKNARKILLRFGSMIITIVIWTGLTYTGSTGIDNTLLLLGFNL